MTRKSLVGAISSELNLPVRYLGMPSVGYQLGEGVYTVDRNGVLEGEDNRGLILKLKESHGFQPVSEAYDTPLPEAEPQVYETIVDKAALASGAPERENTNKRGILDILVDTLNENAGDGERWERQYNTPQMECGDGRWRNLDGRFACTAQSECESVELLYGEPPTPESDGIMNIEIPLSSFSPSAIPKLIKLVDAKSALLKMSLGTDNLPILKTIDTLVFPWFRNDGDPGMAQTYSELICLICKAANEKKRVTACARPPINPCYEMRCFLLSLGCIGSQYKTMRKNLLSGLEGSSSWKYGKKAEAASDEVSQ